MTNALIERRGARTALLTTAGFRDALEIGTEGRYDIYDLGLVKPEPLVERRLRFEVPATIRVLGESLMRFRSRRAAGTNSIRYTELRFDLLPNLVAGFIKDETGFGQRHGCNPTRHASICPAARRPSASCTT